MKICKVESKREVVDTKYEVCGNKYCCKKMEEWLHIGTYHDRRALLYDTDTSRFELRVRESTEYDCGKDARSTEEDLYFCPFCGEKLQEPKLPEEPPIETVDSAMAKKSKKKRFLRKKK